MNSEIKKIVTWKSIYSTYWVLSLSILFIILIRKNVLDNTFLGGYLLFCFLPSIMIYVYNFFQLKRYMETKHSEKWKSLHKGFNGGIRILEFASSEDSLGDVKVAKLKSNWMFSFIFMVGSFFIWITLLFSMEIFRAIVR